MYTFNIYRTLVTDQGPARGCKGILLWVSISPCGKWQLAKKDKSTVFERHAGVNTHLLRKKHKHQSQAPPSSWCVGRKGQGWCLSWDWRWNGFPRTWHSALDQAGSRVWKVENEFSRMWGKAKPIRMNCKPSSFYVQFLKFSETLRNDILDLTEK